MKVCPLWLAKAKFAPLLSQFCCKFYLLLGRTKPLENISVLAEKKTQYGDFCSLKATVSVRKMDVQKPNLSDNRMQFPQSWV